MSYIKKYLSEIDVLKEQLESDPDEIRYYNKYDTFLGSEESIKFIKKKLKKFRK